nr:hypothetical protein [Achromobacter xylosoxidans]
MASTSRGAAVSRAGATLAGVSNQASISSWKISGSPVRHSISRNSVHARLDHV